MASLAKQVVKFTNSVDWMDVANTCLGDNQGRPFAPRIRCDKPPLTSTLELYTNTLLVHWNVCVFYTIAHSYTHMLFCILDLVALCLLFYILYGFRDK